MWILSPLNDEQGTWECCLLNGKQYVIGSSPICDIVISGQAVSSKHALISVAKTNYHDAEQPVEEISVENSSCDHLSVNNGHIVGHSKKTYLNDGDVISFGILQVKFKITYQRLSVVRAGICDSEWTTLKKEVEKLGGYAADQWTNKSTHLIMDLLVLRGKVACAVSSGKPIVTTQYIKDLLDFCDRKTSQAGSSFFYQKRALANDFSSDDKTSSLKPREKNYFPHIADKVLLHYEELLRNPTNDRKNLFKGKLFISHTHHQLKRMKEVIQFAGGHILLKEMRTNAEDDEILSSEDRIVLKIGADDHPDLTAEQRLWMNGVYSKLKQHNRRPVSTLEVYLSILAGSLEYHCNPLKIIDEEENQNIDATLCVDHDKTSHEHDVTEQMTADSRKQGKCDQIVNIDDAKELDITYQMFRKGILEGNFPVNLEKAAKFAAYQIQICHGEFKENLYTSKFNLKDFLPSENKFKKDTLKKKIKEEHKMLGNVNVQMLKYNFINLCLNLATYGMKFFPVEDVNGNQCCFGIGENYLIILDEKTKEVKNNFSYKEINLHYSGLQSFTLHLGDRDDDKYVFWTADGESICQLITKHKDNSLKEEDNIGKEKKEDAHSNSQGATANSQQRYDCQSSKQGCDQQTVSHKAFQPQASGGGPLTPNSNAPVRHDHQSQSISIKEEKKEGVDLSASGAVTYSLKKIGPQSFQESHSQPPDPLPADYDIVQQQHHLPSQEAFQSQERNDSVTEISQQVPAQNENIHGEKKNNHIDNIPGKLEGLPIHQLQGFGQQPSKENNFQQLNHQENKTGHQSSQFDYRQQQQQFQEQQGKPVVSPRPDNLQKPSYADATKTESPAVSHMKPVSQNQHPLSQRATQDEHIRNENKKSHDYYLRRPSKGEAAKLGDSVNKYNYAQMENQNYYLSIEQNHHASNIHGYNAQREKVLNATGVNMLENVGANEDKINAESLQIGSMVEMQVNHKPCYGVLRWRGFHPGFSDELAGIELDDAADMPCNYGTFQNVKYFHSPYGRAFFSKLRQFKPDSRFLDIGTPSTAAMKEVTVEPNEEPVEGSILPPIKLKENFIGRNMGIQGDCNSCYMDATLFAMFAYAPEFDTALNRKKRSGDIDKYEDVQKILREKIVNPLRKNGYVRRGSVYKLREYLEQLGRDSGFMGQEKDPEEFVVLLLEKVLKVDPFIKMSMGNNKEQPSHLYQIFPSKDENNPLPSVQYLLESSFLSSQLQLAEMPSVMVLQMPRFGQEKLYKRIQINSQIDISHLLKDVIHECVICGHSATCYCEECTCLLGWETVYTFLCNKCYSLLHANPKYKNHVKLRTLKSGSPYELTPEDPVMLELFAVLCIETSHYVSFVKCGIDDDEKWLFFDSMADRIGEQDGYNIPEVSQMDELKRYLNGKPLQISDLDKKKDEKLLRVFEDSFLCFYRNKTLSMYK